MADRPTTPSAPKAPSGTGPPAPETRDRAVVRPSAAPAPVDVAAKTKELLVSAPKLEMPKGGGAVKGIGEKFQANPVTGTASFTVPLALSPGRGGFTPALTLSYDSGSGNGPFGVGWSVSVPSIQRKTDKGLPRYRDAEDSDVFVLSDAEDLVPYQEWTGTAWAEPSLSTVTEGTSTYSRRRYRPRVEGGFARIERWTDTSTGAVHWRTWSRENVRRIYGRSASSTLADGRISKPRLEDPDHPSRVFRWLLEEERDEVGNLIRYEYVSENQAGAPATRAEAMRALDGHGCTYTYLKRVAYGNVSPNTWDDGHYFEVVFDYGDHDDTVSPPSSEPSVDWDTRQDIQSSFRSGFDVRCYRLCARVLMFHRFDDPEWSAATDPEEDTNAPVLVRSTELAYADSAVATTLTSVTVRGWRNGSSGWVTETLPLLELGYGEAVIDGTVQLVDGMDDLPHGLDTSRWQWVDLDGEGLTGLLTEQGDQWFYKRSLGAGELGPARLVRSRPAQATLGDPDVRLMDVDGDGRLELVTLRPGMAGSFARDADNAWQGFRPFREVPTINLNDPNVRLLDVDADGLADVLVTDDDCLTWYPSEGRDGWSAPERRRKQHDEDKGPTLVFAGPGETIFLADMTGDGLTDLVRVRNGSICYWPNRGYARFGAKVEMADAPVFDAPDRFDPRRIRLADVDGSGPTDLIYLGPSSVRIWQNQSGNAWSDATTLPEFPGVEDGASIQVQDLLGDGTACLVWSSPLLSDAWRPLRFVHLMADGKPYLLRTIDNNLGRTTTLTYAPSTQFYVADREAGTPWATRLPFPVQVLEQVRVEDAVTGWSNATHYAYHHGYYDSDEREFRGFGKVEQWDTEALPLDGVETYLPPVRTVTWFHTGAWRQQRSLEDAYAAEYFAGDSAAFDRTPCAVDVADDDPAALTARELREAHRALKGRPLRHEVYGTDDESVPYTVTETCFTAARLQRANRDVHGVFVVTPLQTLTYHYERDADDPRVAQERTLEVDAYGTLVRSASIVYPRRGTGHDVAQSTGVCIVTRNEVLHDDDADADRWHIAVPFRARSWQLVHASSTFFASFLDGDDILSLLPPLAGGTVSTTTPVLDFDEDLASTTFLRKLTDKVTTYDDEGTEAAVGTMGERALPYQVYQLAYTSTQAAALDDRLVDLGVTVTTADQGYVELSTTLLTDPGHDADGLWACSGTQDRDAAAFFVPTDVYDPFGAHTTITWHSSKLFPVSVTDPLDNVVACTYDLFALSAASLTDPNESVTQARYDALGRVVALARASAQGDGETDLDDPSQSFAYDLTIVPARTHTAVRVTHASELTSPDESDWIETYAYSDGAGNVVMQKATAAPDPDTPTTLRWVGSGRVVLNNKGLPIKQYEAFFADSEAFESEEGFAGVTPVITYDPVGRPVRVDLPNGTLRRVDFTPWQQATYDENDTIDESTASSTLVTAVPTAHKDTPTVVHLDAQGRPYKTVELAEAGGTPLVTTVTLDVLGNPRAVVDARANASMTPWATQSQTFDLLGRPILTESPDAGDVTALLDATGQPRFLWKEGDLAEEAEYDALRRKVRTWEWTTSGTPANILRERFVFGEALYDEGVYDPVADHLRGRLYRAYDGAGFVQAGYDWKGDTTTSTRRFLENEEAQGEWSDGGAYPFEGDDADSVEAFHTAAEAELEDEEFNTSSSFDALDRVVASTAPDGQTASHAYDEGGRLKSVSVDSISVVASITYNARGQRESIAYGNGVTTTYAYEAETFRLATLTSRRGTDPSGTYVQRLTYRYDAVGNIVEIVDAAQETFYFDNIQVSPNQAFVYDALYRLIQATGREKSNQTQLTAMYADYAGSAGGVPDSGDGASGGSPVLRRYTQSYSYDEVGNITEMKHQNGSGGAVLWRRGYSYEPSSNRLVSTSLPGDDPDDPMTHSSVYDHSARGAITFLPHLRSGGSANVVLSFRDQMTSSLLPTSGEQAFYAYDAGGQRVRKVVKQGNHTERRYVGGWEVWRKYDTSDEVEEARTTLHVMDGESRVAMIDAKTVGANPGTLIRYQLGNHLGSVAVELDGLGGLISYEEYHPYGTTSWWAGDSATVSQKRYRYTGMERDEETGLQCHGVRYYAPWLGRWVSADPIRLGAGLNAFAYCKGAPTILADMNGMEPGGGAGAGRAKDTVEQYAKNWGQKNAEAFLSGFLGLRGPATVIPRGDISSLDFVAPRPGSTLENTSMYRLSIPLVQSARKLREQDPGYTAAMDAMQREINFAATRHAETTPDAAPPPDWKSINGIVFFVDMKALLFGTDPSNPDTKYFKALFGETDGGEPWTLKRMAEMWGSRQDVSFELLDEHGQTFIVSFVEASESTRLRVDRALAETRLGSASKSSNPSAVAEAMRVIRWRDERSPETWKAVLHEFHAHYQAMVQRRAGDSDTEHTITDGLEGQWVGANKF
jgi:RHS repeat-associated protein